MIDNPIIIKIDKLGCLENANNSLLEKSKSFIGKDKNLAVDWTIKAKIPLQNTLFLRKTCQQNTSLTVINLN